MKKKEVLIAEHMDEAGIRILEDSGLAEAIYLEADQCQCPGKEDRRIRDSGASSP